VQPVEDSLLRIRGGLARDHEPGHRLRVAGHHDLFLARLYEADQLRGRVLER
jgi:hypothetical protein